MKKISLLFTFLFFAFHLFAQSKSYESLLQLSKELKQLESTSLSNGIPDYRAKTMAAIQQKLVQIKTRHAKIDTTTFTLEQKVNYVLVLAEINALDYNCRILKPWFRDPSFYALLFGEQSDVPAHEGPTSFAAIDLWTYNYPLSANDDKQLTAQLKVIPPLYQQAQQNLTGNARDLWSAGIDDIKAQVHLLNDLSAKTTNNSNELKAAIASAKTSVVTFTNWLEKQLPLKNGPSGIGKENYTWHLRNVLMVPFSWEEEVTLLNRELARAYASLALEKERNRHLPPLKPYTNEQEYNAGADQHIKQLMLFLKEKDIMPVTAYMEPSLRKHMGSFEPEDKRNFFGNIIHHAPGVLYSHSTHWFELARLKEDPHPDLLRKDPLPYNLWMQRSEGLATSLEETFMHAGLWDDNPHARELVWIMLAQRCARGIASLYAQANMINFEQARKYQVEWTPKGWTGDESLAGFEQHLYLREPGYGTCYVTGKYFIESLMMDMARKEGDSFKLSHFFDAFYGAGILPLSLVRWQMTGDDAEINRLLKHKPGK
ncbi:MAG: hypothetical protein V4717_24540 [Bacteroidota bacterium]